MYHQLCNIIFIIYFPLLRTIIEDDAADEAAPSSLLDLVPTAVAAANSIARQHTISKLCVIFRLLVLIILFVLLLFVFKKGYVHECSFTLFFLAPYSHFRGFLIFA